MIRAIRLVLLCSLLVLSASANLVDFAAGGSVTGNAFTTAPKNMSGANLCIAAVSSFQPWGQATVSDSTGGGNWTNALTHQDAPAGGDRIQFFWKTVVGSATHQFTVGPNGLYGSAIVLCFDGAHATAPYGGQNGSQTVATTIQPGPVDPSADNCIVVTAVSHNITAGGTISIAGTGFTSVLSTVDYVGVDHYGISAAYSIQTTATQTNPTWTRQTADGWSSVIAYFTPAAGGGGGGSYRVQHRINQ